MAEGGFPRCQEALVLLRGSSIVSGGWLEAISSSGALLSVP